MLSPTAPPLTGLPDADYLIERQGSVNSSMQQSMKDLFTQLVPLVLSDLARRIGSVMPSRTFYDEAMHVPGYLPRAMPRFWPVLGIQKALLGGITPLSIGTEIELAQGRKQIAITEGGRYVVLACATESTIFLTYSAGYDSLPSDLLEVFFEMSMLCWKEKDRIGQTSMQFDGAKVAMYTRKLPDWCTQTLNRYYRMDVFR